MQPDVKNNKLILTADRNGAYEPVYQKVKVNIIGLPFEPSSFIVDGQSVEFEPTYGKSNEYTATVCVGFKQISIV